MKKQAVAFAFAMALVASGCGDMNNDSDVFQDNQAQGTVTNSDQASSDEFQEGVESNSVYGQISLQTLAKFVHDCVDRGGTPSVSRGGALSCLGPPI